MTHYVVPALLIAAALCCISLPAVGNTLRITLTDLSNQPLADAVVEVIATSQPLPGAAAVVSVAQQGLTFQPFVTAVQAGTLVEFPNKDKTRHHVYSFSDAKTFEIQLYAGKPEQPVLFDKPGIVVLGCNIHDYMQAYIYVGESPLLAITDADGTVQFNQLAPGGYQLKLWHPGQQQSLPAEQITITGPAALQRQLAADANTKPIAPKRGFGG